VGGAFESFCMVDDVAHQRSRDRRSWCAIAWIAAELARVA
jgi:hypothetical protein